MTISSTVGGSGGNVVAVESVRGGGVVGGSVPNVLAESDPPLHATRTIAKAAVRARIMGREYR